MATMAATRRSIAGRRSPPPASSDAALHAAQNVPEMELVLPGDVVNHRCAISWCVIESKGAAVGRAVVFALRFV